MLFFISSYMANFISSLSSNKEPTHICSTRASSCTGTMQYFLVTSIAHWSAYGLRSIKLNPEQRPFKNSTDWHFTSGNLKRQTYFHASRNTHLESEGCTEFNIFMTARHLNTVDSQHKKNYNTDSTWNKESVLGRHCEISCMLDPWEDGCWTEEWTLNAFS